MISYDEALAAVLSHARPLGEESAPLESLTGKVLAAPVRATTDLPLFDNSAVDGFGVRIDEVAGASDGTPVRLLAAGTVAAGSTPPAHMPSGAALKILTGAPVPPYVEAVVMREFCSESDGTVLVHRPAAAGENVRRRGEEFQQGDEILPSGLRVTPAVLGMIATLGHISFPAYVSPRVAVISTGDELVQPGTALAAGQIYDSNSFSLEQAVRLLGLDVVRMHAPDDAESTRKAIASACHRCEVVVAAGGVSVGDYDFVKDVAVELGVETVFWKVSIKPGKPVFFGTLAPSPHSASKLLFGLPGNPVSALVTYHQIVKPALLKVMGVRQPTRPRLRARLARTLKRRRADRLEFIRARLTTENGLFVAHPTTGQDSHMMGGLAQADCLVYFPAGQTELEEGSQVEMDLIEWGR